MPLIFLPKLRLNAEISGPMGGAPMVFLHALGTHMGIWDGLLPQLPRHRILRLDLRGHGASDAPAPPYSMGAMIHDVEEAMAHFGMKETVVVGVSLGGLIAQGLAIKRLDLVRGAVLANTAAKIGGPSLWQSRIETVSNSGLEPYAAGAMERIFGPRWQTAPQMPRVRQMLLDTPLVSGYDTTFKVNPPLRTPAAWRCTTCTSWSARKGLSSRSRAPALSAAMASAASA